VRRGVIGPAVGLDLDDAAEPSAARIVADEVLSEDGLGRRGDRALQRVGAARGQDPLPTYGAVTEAGTRNPKMEKNAGMIVSMNS